MPRRRAKRFPVNPLSVAIAAAFLAQPGAVTAQSRFDLADLDGASGLRVVATEEFWAIGQPMDGIGDFNGDGFDDIAFSTGSAAGFHSFVVFGTDSGVASLTTPMLDGPNGFVISPGVSAAAAGDFNGDGFADVTVSNIYANGFRGETYIVFGTDSIVASPLDPSTLTWNTGLILQGESADDYSGLTIAGAGDFNGDGLDDVAVSAFDLVSSFQNRQCYLVFGRRIRSLPPPPVTFKLSSLNGFNGIEIVSNAGPSRPCVEFGGRGDVNGDGFDDLLVRDDLRERIHLIFGRATPRLSPPTEFDVQDIDGSNGFSFTLENSLAAPSLSAMSDVDGDGFADPVIGDLGATVGGNANAGKAYVVFGREDFATALIDLQTLDGDDGFAVQGEEESARLGSAASGVGDINGDGFDDILVGKARPPTEPGEALLVFGGADGFPASVSPGELDGRNGLTFEGVANGDRTGLTVGSAGDFNGDGLFDLLISAPYADPGSNADAGLVYVVFGNGSPRATSNSVSQPPEFAEDGPGSGVQLEAMLADGVYVDEEPFAGAAVVGNLATPGQGEWQYSLDGTVWNSVPLAPSDTNALVLDTQSRLRFASADGFSGTPGALVARMWDGNWRTVGNDVDIESAVGAFGGFAGDAHLVSIDVEVVAGELIFRNGFGE